MFSYYAKCDDTIGFIGVNRSIWDIWRSCSAVNSPYSMLLLW